MTVKLDTGKASVAEQGDAVTIELGNGRTVAGTVRSVGTVVHSEDSNGSTSNYLDVVVAIDGGQTVGLDDAPVTVDFTRVGGQGRAGRAGARPAGPGRGRLRRREGDGDRPPSWSR